MRRRMLHIALLLVVLSLASLQVVPPADAQKLSFTLRRNEVDVWINPDGSVRLDYRLTFTVAPGSAPIDIVDLGLPTGDFSYAGILGYVDGKQTVSVGSDYEGDGTGVALHLGAGTIRAGQTGTVRVIVNRVGRMLWTDTSDRDYASINFAPVYFGRSYTEGVTDMTVRLHLPPGVQPDEPRWHKSPEGFPDEPARYLDEEGRVVYEWNNQNALPYQEYRFGASFPMAYVDAGVIQRSPSWLSTAFTAVVGFLCNPTVLVIGFVALLIGLSSRANARRRMQYLPPSLQVEGVGIKRGLTAIEAAIVLETPLNKILTMMLFSLMKKDTLAVLEDNPLRVEANQPRPQDLRAYEVDFLEAIRENGALNEDKLQKAIVALVKAVNNKMKGFSRKETLAYYRDIVKRAWDQVAAAETPEVRGQVLSEGLEWTMLDNNFGKRTAETFGEGPVVLPTWWGHYRPWAQTAPAAAPGGGALGPSGPVRLPTLPGADFAASIVRGVEGTAGRIVRSVTGFTGGVTQTTNPPPKTSSSGGGSRSSGGGGGCACACACAGCACACAGGGR